MEWIPSEEEYNPGIAKEKWIELVQDKNIFNENALITNFHQPHSTLLLLLAAFVGDEWHRIYEYALANDYRFLSYGDSSLLIP